MHLPHDAPCWPACIGRLRNHQWIKVSRVGDVKVSEFCSILVAFFTGLLRLPNYWLRAVFAQYGFEAPAPAGRLARAGSDFSMG